MYRSLRFQLIVLVLVTVAGVLAVSQWVASHLSALALESNLRERAILALRTADSLWGRVHDETLHDKLTQLTEDVDEVEAIDLMVLHDGMPEVDVTARDLCARARIPADLPPDMTRARGGAEESGPWCRSWVSV